MPTTDRQCGNRIQPAHYSSQIVTEFIYIVFDEMNYSYFKRIANIMRNDEI